MTVDASFACAVPGSFPGDGYLPEVGIQISPESYAERDPVVACDPTPRVGVVIFRQFVLTHLGGRDLGICPPQCRGSSEHNEGRAWDWGVNADDPADVARVNKLFEWLLATSPAGEPHSNFRRLGLRYMIWDRQIWSSATQEWRPYTGQSAHREHVHFSWGWPGARAETSFYDWLQGGSQPLPVEPEAPNLLAPLLVIGGGALAGWYAAALVLRARRA